LGEPEGVCRERLVRLGGARLERVVNPAEPEPEAATDWPLGVRARSVPQACASGCESRGRARGLGSGVAPAKAVRKFVVGVACTDACAGAGVASMYDIESALSCDLDVGAVEAGVVVTA
jgi:hypothetical protein